MKGAKREQKAAPFKGQAENRDRGRKTRGKGKFGGLFSFYSKDLHELPRLSPEEEKELGRIVKNGLEEIFGVAMEITLDAFQNLQKEIRDYKFLLQTNKKYKGQAAKWRAWEEASRLFYELSLNARQSNHLESGLNGKIMDFSVKYREVAWAINKMTTGNLRLVLSVVQEYYYPRFSSLELIQEGNLGLMKSLITFDYTRGRLSTYIFWGIRRAILKAIQNKVRLIRLPGHINNLVFRVFRVSAYLRHKLGREPMPEEIAQHMQIGLDAAEMALENIREPVISLNLPRFWDSENQKIGDFVIDPRDNALGEIAKREFEEGVRDLLSEDFLLPQEIKVLCQRFGLNEKEEEHTLQEVGNGLGVTRERVRQIQNKTFPRLRKIAKRKGLEIFLED